MYEASFGMIRRPFAATPDATCFLSAGRIQAAFDEIVVCIEQGQGIAVLTAPAGIGKTLLCERLCGELSDRFQTVFLRHSSFLTRRALLQTLLCELNHSYQQPSEHELRLELFPAIRALRPQREALVVICDEAHQLPESLIEELRILADFAESGRPLVRLVLVGQLSLEEKLAQPGMEAFNQRIRAQVNLPTFDRAGSLDYIDYRLTWGGGRTEEIFTSDALDVIARASDGIPRCINQLADHSLLLAYVAEQKPVGRDIVLEALNDLRQLPLHWDESSLSQSSFSSSDHLVIEDNFEIESSSSGLGTAEVTAESTSDGMTYSYEPDSVANASDRQIAVSDFFEAGAIETHSVETSPTPVETPTSADEIPIKIGSDEWQHVISLFSPAPRDEEIKLPSIDTRHQISQPLSQELKRNGFQEEVVIDRYAAIDAGLAPVAVSATDTARTELVRAQIVSVEQRVLDVVHNLIDVVSEKKSLNERRPIFQIEMPEIDFDDFSNDGGPQVEGSKQTHAVESDAVEYDGNSSSSSSHAEAFSDIGAIIDRVDSSHEFSRPLGLLTTEDSSSIDSVRDGNGDRVATSTLGSASGHSSFAEESGWDAVETDSAESTSQSRPFRYLFSMLRRKQQQKN